MNRAEMIEAVVANKKSGIETKAGADRALQAVLDAIKVGLKKDGLASVVGFGTFKVKTRAARMGRNPQTGESIKIGARKAVTFKASTDLKKSV
ncbi:MAG: HU family DNA-binding protein [Candidatus Aureabacteria bacterium]|nr:HU family DNA-binding protein [Candidatus Auribacterota bacterium]